MTILKPSVYHFMDTQWYVNKLYTNTSLLSFLAQSHLLKLITVYIATQGSLQWFSFCKSITYMYKSGKDLYIMYLV